MCVVCEERPYILYTNDLFVSTLRYFGAMGALIQHLGEGGGEQGEEREGEEEAQTVQGIHYDEQ